MTSGYTMVLSSAATGDEVLPFGKAILIAGFTIAVVFGVLLLIYFLLRFFSFVINAIVGKKSSTAPVATAAPAVATADGDFSSGSLKLKGCDEKTAAMIMAIVSDNTGIPLSELVFKSITLVENK